MMTLKEEIELQLRENKLLSYEILSQLKDKNYFSGRSKEIGDTVLFGMLTVEDYNGNPKLITFHQEEIDVLYEEDSEWYKKPKQTKLPYIKLIENGN